MGAQSLRGLDQNEFGVESCDSLLDASSYPEAHSRCESGASTDALTIDEMLSLHVGEFGPGQQLHFCLASLPWISEALQTLREYRTASPSCGQSNNYA